MTFLLVITRLYFLVFCSMEKEESEDNNTPSVLEQFRRERNVVPAFNTTSNWYRSLTKGTPFEPWLSKAMHDKHQLVH